MDSECLFTLGKSNGSGLSELQILVLEHVIKRIHCETPSNSFGIFIRTNTCIFLYVFISWITRGGLRRKEYCIEGILRSEFNFG